MIKSNILTRKAAILIEKKMRNARLTQQDSNYLSRFVRPKLREMDKLDAGNILKRIEYVRAARPIENKIKDIVLRNVHNVDSIILCGSAIQTNYTEYNDIDVIVATKSIIKNQRIKTEIIKKMIGAGHALGLNLDFQIYAKKSIIKQYPSNPSLIYQLKDSKVIYGNLNLPKRISLTSLDLKMKLDWSEGLNANSGANEIYLAIRNSMLVLLIMNLKIDNFQLKANLLNSLGNDLCNNLKNNRASNLEKKLALSYLSLLNRHLEEELRKPKWERIELETP